MTFSEFQSSYREILDLVLNKRLREAIHSLSKQIIHVSSSELHNRFEAINDTFQNMLKYSFEFAPDPERDKIYIKLQQTILELSDDIREAWYTSRDLFERKMHYERVHNFEAEYLQDNSQLMNILSFADSENPDQPHKQELANKLFYYFWLQPRLKDEASTLFEAVIDADDINDGIKELSISAITLSLLRHFDRSKFILLFNLSKSENPLLRQRAMIGMFLAVILYKKRLVLYGDLMHRLKSIPDEDLFQERMLALLLQFIRAGETEKITRKIQEEIVPEVLKMRSDLEEKLKLDDLLSKENFEDKNPEWENFFKDSPDVYQKLEQFSKMQIEGADVFMGAFAMLKHFPFFKELPNWFLPFKADNPVVHKAFEGVDEGLDVSTFLEGLEQSTVLCNSDKFSFCLNIQHMPAEQRKMMLDLFNMELKAMNEMMEDEIKLNTEAKNKIINTQYFQDLYRFFKLYPNKKEYQNVFDIEADIFQSEVLMNIFNDPKILRNLAEFYFARDNYSEAIKVFEFLNQKEQSFELLEKQGFCAQKLGNFDQAINFYKQAELFDKNKLWLQKKLGYCYRKTGNFTQAIDYYKQINKSEPNDFNNMAYLGQLHIDIEDYEEALKYYYEVEYHNPNNAKVYRPIGWCSFALGKTDNAIKYFRKMIDVKPTKSDFLNIGHCYWVKGEIGLALDSYREAFRLSGQDAQWFRDAFTHDSKYLNKAGFTELDIILMKDYVLL